MLKHSYHICGQDATFHHVDVDFPRAVDFNPLAICATIVGRTSTVEVNHLPAPLTLVVKKEVVPFVLTLDPLAVQPFAPPVVEPEVMISPIVSHAHPTVEQSAFDPPTMQPLVIDPLAAMLYLLDLESY